MSKPKEHAIKKADVQAVLMSLKELRKGVEQITKEQASATTQVILVWIVSRIRDAERLTLEARSGPGTVEQLRKEGHDV